MRKKGLEGAMFAGAKQGDTLEILLYDVIGRDWWSGGGCTAADISQAIKDAGDFSSITMRVNSPGGDVFEGVAIYNLVKAQGKPVTVYVDGIAASAASFISMAGDRVVMGLGSMMMVHNAWTMAMGNAGDLRKVADTLDKVSASFSEIYTARTGMNAAEIASLMDEETWLSAEDAVTYKFADEVAKEPAKDSKKALALASKFSALFKSAPSFEEQAQPPASETVLPEQQPEGGAAAASVDWQAQLDILRKRLDLNGQ